MAPEKVRMATMAKRTPTKGQTGLLFILSAPSGAGKSTLCHILLDRIPELRYSVSTTTRAPRKDEVNGVDYLFTDEASFKAGIKTGRWAEWAEVHGNYYGTSAEFIDHERAIGNDVLLDIDVQGADQMRNKYPDAITIFIMPPSFDDLRQRLEKRGGDSPEIIDRRLANARQEMAQQPFYRHTIVNDRLEEAAVALETIIRRHQEP